MDFHVNKQILTPRFTTPTLSCEWKRACPPRGEINCLEKTEMIAGTNVPPRAMHYARTKAGFEERELNNRRTDELKRRWWMLNDKT